MKSAAIKSAVKPSTTQNTLIALLLILGLTLSMNPIARAQDSVFLDNFPDRYVVVKGDTLWDISEKFLRTPWLWPEIWYANPQIKNPHLIFPGDVITRVVIDGQERLTVIRTEKLQPQAQRLTTDRGLEKLSPKVRPQDASDAIPSISLTEINSFLSRSRIVEPGVLEAAPYVIGGQEKRLILGAGDRLYARGSFSNEIPSYGVYRIGEPYVDPETEEVLGIQAMDKGTANIRAINGEIGTFSITRATGDIRPGDRTLPITQRPIDTTFFPSSPDNAMTGEIISVEKGVRAVGLLDVIVLNRGSRDNLSVGNVLAIYKEGEVVRDQVTEDRRKRSVKLPDEQAGLVMAFQVFEKMSLGIVLQADKGIAVGDTVRTP